MFVDPPGDHSWVFDLVAGDDVVRARALARHQALVAAAVEARHWQNRLWAAQGGVWNPMEPHVAAEMDQALADLSWHYRQTVFGPIGALFCSDHADAVAQHLYSPYLVLYLRWEANYPREWGAPGSSFGSRWGTKEALLGRLDRDGVVPEARPEIRDLIIAALRRPYRCKDWMYARLVRHVLDPHLLGAVEDLSDAEDPLIRLRAKFVLHVAGDSAQRIKRTSWHRWLASEAVDA